LIAGTAATAVAWLNARGTETTTTAAAVPIAAAVERPHRTLLGVL
jgi:mannose/fructose/N-acetylgalactosamine-specific phosphotransferase system component IIC